MTSLDEMNPGSNQPRRLVTARDVTIAIPCYNEEAAIHEVFNELEIEFPDAEILVVDDEAVIRELMSEILSDEGYEVDSAPNGIVALEILNGNDDITLWQLLNVKLLNGRGSLACVVFGY